MTKLQFIVENWNIYDSVDKRTRHRTNFIVSAYFHEEDSSEEELALEIQDEFK
jgi:hypothetical protein